MLFYLVLVVTIAISVAPGSTSEFKCRGIPSEIVKCMGFPRISVAESSVKKCTAGSECDKLTCIFTNAGWLADGQLNLEKWAQYYDQLIKDHPQWTRAMQQAKTDCLYNSLPIQSFCLDSPAYDVILCTLRSLIQYAEPGQWSKEEKCKNARRYAKECAPCPTECFSQYVPYGTCNACLSIVPNVQKVPIQSA